jgi:hypothetical protein
VSKLANKKANDALKPKWQRGHRQPWQTVQERAISLPILTHL